MNLPAPAPPLRPLPGPGMAAHVPASVGPAPPNGPALSDEDYHAIARLVHDRTGIVLGAGKRWMLASRLTRALRRLGLPDFASYRRLLAGPGAEEEMAALTSAITTNVTSFFRGPDHFEALAALVPTLRDKAARGQRIRLWSAGCSTGQEPCSMAMTLLGHWPEAAQADLRILATDIDADVIETARRGLFEADPPGGPGEKILRRFSTPGPAEGTLVMAPAVRNLIRYEPLNLLAPWPFSGRFDAIFCRNVVIYFDGETRIRLWHRLADRIAPGGWLFIGHSERIDRPLAPYLAPAGMTRYRRTEVPVAAGLAAPQIADAAAPATPSSPSGTPSGTPSGPT